MSSVARLSPTDEPAILASAEGDTTIEQAATLAEDDLDALLGAMLDDGDSP